MAKNNEYIVNYVDNNMPKDRGDPSLK